MQTKTKHENKESNCTSFPKLPLRRRVQIFFNDPSLTQQSHKDEVDINNIIKKYKVTGILPVGAKMPVYEDVSNIPDYQTALNTVRQAEENFAALPSKIRSRFNNDPQQLIEFLGNAQNQAEAVEMGLVEAQPSKAPESPQESNPTPNKPKSDPGKEGKNA